MIATDNGEGLAQVNAYGIYTVDLFGGGEINNSGTVKVRARSDAYGGSSAAGIYVGNSIHDGTVSNTGTIDVAFDSTDPGSLAYGIYAGSMLVDGAIDNAGAIKVASSIENGTGSAYGIYVNDIGQFGIAGDITNSGSITVSSDATGQSGSAYAYGINAAGVTTGLITNSGTISATASDIAEGIRISVLTTGRVENSGKIAVTAIAENNTGYAYGILANSVGAGASVFNSGEIIADSSDSASDSAFGVKFGDFDGTFENTGKIVSSGTAIYLDGDDNGEFDGNVLLSSAGFVAGTIELLGVVDVKVKGDVGMSVHWTVDGDDTLAGVQSINEDTIAVFTSGMDGSAPENLSEYATYDASSFAANRQQGASSGMAGMGDLVAATAGSTAVSPQVTSGAADAGGFKPFANASSSRLSYAGNDVSMDQSVNTTTLTVGGTKQTDGGFAFGLAAGTAMGATSVAGQWATSSESKSNSAFAGLSLASTMGNVTLSGGVTAGSVNFDNIRYVNDNLADGGIAEMTSSNSDNYLGLQLGMTGRYTMGADLAILPSAMVSYASHATSGFEEEGDAGAAVDASSFGVAQGEFGLAIERTMAQGVLSLGVSQITRSFNGATSVDVALLDDRASLDASIPNTSATKVSIGYAAGTVGSAQFNFGAETLLGAGGTSGSKISGTISFRF